MNMEKTIRNRWNALPERGAFAPDSVLDADNAQTALSAAQQRLADAEAEYSAATTRAYQELAKNWTKEELAAAGFE